MRKTATHAALLCLITASLLTGCGMPYKEEYEEAMRLKALAEQKAAEAEAAAARAQDALNAEQNAVSRLYQDD